MKKNIATHRALRAGAQLALVLLAASAFARTNETPWIGVELENGPHGPRIRQVLPGTPGERAHLAGGDEILAVGSTPASSPDALIAAVRKAGVGHTVELRVRDAKGKERTVQLALEAKPAPEKIQADTVLDKPAPDFQPLVQAGPALGKISSLKGQVVLIDFFATWCGPCVEAMPEVEKMHRELGPKGLKVLGISTEEKKIVAAAAQRFHVSYSLASDEDEGVMRRYRVFALPTMIVIDRAGVVRKVAVNEEETIRKAVEEALGK